MRDIKFRAWDAIAKKMWTPIVGLNGVLLTYNQIGGYVSFPAYEDPLMQYTGLKDKNGIEIYEGDIIKDEIDGYHDTVVYKENKFILEPTGDDCVYWDKCEVIGNIYENPELLNDPA